VDFTYFLRQTLNILFDLFSLFLILRVILSWFRHEAHGLTRLLYEVTEPILAPIRRVIPALGMIDISPLIAFLLLDLIRILINSYL
jgi:YggT family protein